MTALRVEHDVERLSRHVARLSLCCQAMWELIRDNTNLAEEEKLKMLNEERTVHHPLGIGKAMHAQFILDTIGRLKKP